MTQQINTMLCQGINLTTATTWTVTDDDGVGRTITFNPAATSKWYRIKLAPSGGTGTEASPLELLAHVQAQLRAGTGHTYWDVVLDSTGFVKFSYTGPTSGQVTALDSVVAPCLGVTTTFTATPLASHGADYHPTHVMYAASCTDDTDWSPRPDMIGGVEHDDGTGDSLRAGSTGAERAFTFYAHPRDWATKVSRAAACTPIYAPESEWTNTTSYAPTLAPPWSVQRFMSSSLNRRVSYVEAFQSFFGGSPPTKFFECTLSLDTSRNRDPVRPTRPYYKQILNWGPVKLRFVAYQSL